MSTKCSLVWGDKFHVYTDCVEEHAFVYVEMDGTTFEASPGRVTIQIPLAIWERIRAYSPAEYNLADLSDAELSQLAGKQLDEQRKELSKAQPNSMYRALLFFHQPAGKREILRNLRAARKFQRDLRDEVEQLRKPSDKTRSVRSGRRRAGHRTSK